MKIAQAKEQLQNIISENRTKSIGFVPTMGALHEGHLRLIAKSKEITDITVCSIFVNPIQFNDPSDFEKYPVTTEKDIALLETVDCDILFLPEKNEIYPEGLNELRHYDLGYLENILEGEFRPGHFQGVCQVVDRLLQVVMPNYLIMGAKDYQQCMVIKKLLEISPLFKTVELIIAPTVRESSGLAKSSRNMRLNEDGITKAITIFQTLHFIKQNLTKGDVKNIIELSTKQLIDAGFEKVDYVSIADADTLELIDHWDGEKKLVILIAAFLNGVRLIDNIVMTK